MASLQKTLPFLFGKPRTGGPPGSSAYSSLLGAAPDAAQDTAAAHMASIVAAAIQRRKAASGQGRASTLLTGPSGVKPPAPTNRNTLLGS